MSQWRKCKLGDVAEITSSKRIYYSEYVNSGVPFFRSKEIIERFNKQNTSLELFIKREKYDEIKARFGAPKEGDMLLTSVGTLGVPYTVRKDDEFYFKDGNLTWFRNIDPKMIDNRFLYYWIISAVGQQKLYEASIGSTQPALTIVGLKDIDIILPPLSEQHAIAGVLSSLDDKIDLLHRQNKTLEGMAEALWRKIFVEEADPEWKKGKLSDIAKNVKVSVHVKNVQHHENYVGLEHLERKHLAFCTWGQTDKLESNKSKFDRGDILFGKLRSYFHKVCFAPIDGICSTDILVIRPKKPEYFSLCLMWFFSEDVVNYSDASSGGTRMPRTNWETLGGYDIEIPDDTIISGFDREVRPLIQKIEHNIFTIRNLSSLRNVVLPKLISGEMRANT